MCKKIRQMYEEKKREIPTTQCPRKAPHLTQMVYNPCCLGFSACSSYYSLRADDALVSYLNTHTKRESSEQQMDNKPRDPLVCHKINEDIYFY